MRYKSNELEQLYKDLNNKRFHYGLAYVFLVFCYIIQVHFLLPFRPIITDIIDSCLLTLIVSVIFCFYYIRLSFRIQDIHLLILEKNCVKYVNSSLY